MKRLLLPVVALMLVVPPLPGQSPEQKQATVAFVQKLQAKDGGFLPAPGQANSSLGATNAALRALKYFGGQVANPEGCADFVTRCYDKNSGGFADSPGGKPTVRATAVGLMALEELKRPLDAYEAGALKFLGEYAHTFEDIRIAAAGLEVLGKLPPQASKWRDGIRKMREAGGAFGEGPGQARATGGAAVALLRLGGKLEHPDGVTAALQAGQRPDGAWGQAEAKGSDLESSYRVMRAVHVLHAKPDADRVRGFIARCRNADGGYAVQPGQASSLAATYFATIILHWLDEGK